MKLNIVILYLIYGFQQGLGQNAYINATDKFILGTDRIEIDCQPAGSLYAQINALSILKNSQPMISAGILNEQTNMSWQDASVQRRATTNTPDLSTVAASLLRITIEATNTQCNDEAVYTCRVNGLDSNFSPVLNNEVSHSVIVEVKPDKMDNMEISPLPSITGGYSDGQNITLSCTGTVGAYTDPLNITWCIQRSGDSSPTDLESDDYFISISHSNPQPIDSGPTTSCQFERNSSVVYQVADTDIDTTFWCQVTAPGDSDECGQGTVRQQKRIAIVQTTQAPESVVQTDGDTVNVGAIVGGIIGGVALTVLVVLIIKFVSIRKKNQVASNRSEEKVIKDENEVPVYSVPNKHELI